MREVFNLGDSQLQTVLGLQTHGPDDRFRPVAASLRIALFSKRLAIVPISGERDLAHCRRE